MEGSDSKTLPEISCGLCQSVQENYKLSPTELGMCINNDKMSDIQTHLCQNRW